MRILKTPEEIECFYRSIDELDCKASQNSVRSKAVHYGFLKKKKLVGGFVIPNSMEESDIKDAFGLIGELQNIQSTILVVDRCWFDDTANLRLFDKFILANKCVRMLKNRTENYCLLIHEGGRMKDLISRIACCVPLSELSSSNNTSAMFLCRRGYLISEVRRRMWAWIRLQEIDGTMKNRLFYRYEMRFELGL